MRLPLATLVFLSGCGLLADAPVDATRDEIATLDSGTAASSSPPARGESGGADADVDADADADADASVAAADHAAPPEPEGNCGSPANSGGAPITKIFVTSASFSANLGGIAGANAKCAAAALAGSQTGTWRALLSTSCVDAKSRFPNIGTIRSTRGDVIADGATELWAGKVRHLVDGDEYGNFRSVAIIWTGTDTDGMRDRSPHTKYCDDWLGTAGGVEAGRNDATDYRWVSIYDRDDQSTHAYTATSALICLGTD